MAGLDLAGCLRFYSHDHTSDTKRSLTDVIQSTSVGRAPKKGRPIKRLSCKLQSWEWVISSRKNVKMAISSQGGPNDHKLRGIHKMKPISVSHIDTCLPFPLHSSLMQGSLDFFRSHIPCNDVIALKVNSICVLHTLLILPQF